VRSGRNQVQLVGRRARWSEVGCVAGGVRLTWRTGVTGTVGRAPSCGIATAATAAVVSRDRRELRRPHQGRPNTEAIRFSALLAAASLVVERCALGTDTRRARAHPPSRADGSSSSSANSSQLIAFSIWLAGAARGGRAEDQRFDGRFGKVERLRDLRVGPPLELAEDERLALRLRERRHRDAQLLGPARLRRLDGDLVRQLDVQLACRKAAGGIRCG